ncbi:sensor domain-containing diguanylate cyclase [Sulfurimonas marina]|uniref:diguanylate cyclase n=1 Tax=Sulfurimonas marina TaxID=2590551 RepID=A0A7M1ATZ3_9BACT|nr:diguanylate cyclase [Sulfurimonas marina]QOP40901.1 GGDEF domain-containing protein [Sulfurimonas marina]
MRIFFLLLFTIISIYAQDISITANGQKISNFPLEIYEDKSRGMTFSDVQNLTTFQSYTSNISKGYSDSAFWIRFTVKNSSIEKLNYFIFFTETYLNKVDGYIINADNSFTEFHYGVWYLTQSQRKDIVKPTMAIELNPQEKKTVYIRMFSKYPMFTAIHLFDEEGVDDFSYLVKLFHIFFLGAVLALVLYNLGIFFFIRDISYLYYIFFISGFAIWQMISIGVFPFDSFQSTFSFYAFSMAIPLFQAFLMLFTRSLLDLKHQLPQYAKLLKVVAYLYIVFSISMLFDPARSLFVMNTFSTFILPLLLFVGYESYKIGNKIAKYFLIAQFCFLSMGTLFALAAYGLLEFNIFTRYGIIVGSFGEMIFFALALAYRIKVLETEKLEFIELTNKELDQKVQSRTQELQIAKDKLEKLANKDSLTGLHNRRALFNESSKFIQLAKRESQPLSLIMFDLDNFKNINDTYGHAVGDEVLKAFAEQLRHVRESDIAARIGGEEFILFCPNTDLESATILAQQIRTRTEELAVVTEDTALFFTVSAGVSTLDFTNDKKIDDLMLRADKALYEAKNKGRNSVVQFK